jgi:hypothetical protein
MSVDLRELLVGLRRKIRLKSARLHDLPRHGLKIGSGGLVFVHYVRKATTLHRLIVEGLLAGLPNIRFCLCIEANAPAFYGAVPRDILDKVAAFSSE